MESKLKQGNMTRRILSTFSTLSFLVFIGLSATPVASQQLITSIEPLSIRGTNYFPMDTPWSGMWVGTSTATFDADMARAQALNINTIRTFLDWNTMVDSDGNVNQTYLDKFESLLNSAWSHGIRTVVCFDWWCFKPEAAWKNAMSAFVVPHASDGRILMWDLINEPEGAEGGFNNTSVRDYIAKSVAYIKTLDSNHLTTIAAWQTELLAGIAMPDVCQHHDYTPTYDIWSQKVESVGWRIRYNELYGLGRPMFFGEFGWNTQGTGSETEAQQATRYGVVLNAAERYRIGGAMNWCLYDYPHQNLPEAQRYYGIYRTDYTLKPAGVQLRETYRAWVQQSNFYPWQQVWYDHQDNTSGWDSGSMAQVTDPTPNDSKVRIKNTVSTGSWCITKQFNVDLDAIDYLVAKIDSASSSTDFAITFVIYDASVHEYTIVPRTAAIKGRWVINLTNWDLATTSGSELVQIKIWVYGSVNKTIDLDYLGLVSDHQYGFWDNCNSAEHWHSGSNSVVQDALADDSLFEQIVTASPSGCIESDAISTDVSVAKWLNVSINSIPVRGKVRVEVEDLAPGGIVGTVFYPINAPGAYVSDLRNFPWAVPGNNQTFRIRLTAYGSANSICVWDRISVSWVAAGDQIAGTISGVVKDPSGATVSGVTVSTNTGGYQAVTGGDGKYSLWNVNAGTYNLTASKSGYSNQIANGMQVVAGQSTTCDLVLSPVLVSVTRISEAKWLTDGTWIAITSPKIVTCGSSTFADGSAYVEDPDRASGIKLILLFGATVNLDEQITLTGIIRTDANGERNMEVTSVDSRI